MRIECQTCNTKFKLDDSLIKKDGTKVRCSKCKEIITVYPQDENAPDQKKGSKRQSSGEKQAHIHEAEVPKKSEKVDIEIEVKPKKASTRLMILIGLLILTITGGCAFYFNYLHIYSIVVLSFIFLTTLWPQLNNIAAGIWIKADPQFKVGDLISIDKQAMGYVVSINYRTTQLKSDSKAIISIPNNTLIKNKIINYSIHPESYPLSCEVEVDINNKPERVQKILMDAVLPVKGVINDPSPYTTLNLLSANGIGSYSLYFYIEDQSLKSKAFEEIWNKIWHLFKRSGILPYIVDTKKESDETYKSILEEVEIFRPFTEYAKSYLSKNMNKKVFQPEEHIFHQGDKGNSLYIIEEGVVSVQVEITPGKSIEVARLGAGSCFGEMALLTGEARAANIVTISDTISFEITRDHIAPLIEEQPQISQALSELLVQRKIETESEKNKYRAEKINRKALKKQIMEQIDSYFKSNKMEE